jgi:hypothetical protein
MDYKLLLKDLLEKNIEELDEIQKTSLFTITPCLVALSKNTNLDVNKSFFLFCMSCLGCDKIVTPNEYTLMKKFISVNASIEEVQHYVNELLDVNLLNFTYELVKSVSSVSNEGKEELIRFASCFLVADNLNQEKEDFLNKLIDIH